MELTYTSTDSTRSETASWSSLDPHVLAIPLTTPRPILCSCHIHICPNEPAQIPAAITSRPLWTRRRLDRFAL